MAALELEPTLPVASATPGRGRADGPDVTATDAARGPSAEAPAALTLAPGAMLAHYRIDGPIGQGGMGEVYRATDLALDRPVALKVLPAPVAGDAARRERMIREARAQARLTHAHVCHIYFVGEEAGRLFFAMELVPGESLAERVARGPLPPEEAIEVVRMAALGLREAWAHGFTHRDVKPSNLMIDGRGDVKLVDFGLVTRAAGERPDDADGEAGAPAVTTAVGTPLYMAPEQAAGEAVDFRADLYALGATLHHLVSGRPPFVGESVADLRSQHATAARPVLGARARRGRVLGLLDDVIAKMMAKAPGDRYASYDELIAALDRISPARTRPAGVIVRGFAALVDFMIAGLASVPLQYALPGVRGALILWTTIFVYQVVGVARWGRTAGRWLLEIECVGVATARPPGLARAALRTALEYGAIAAMSIAHRPSSVEDQGGANVSLGDDAVSLVAIGVIVAILVWAAWARADKRSLWDHAAGTMVRYRPVAPR